MNKNIQKILDSATCDAFFANAPMEPLPLLDAAEVRANKCPLCRTPYHLHREDGFKICINCNSNFKIWGNNAYYIRNPRNLGDFNVNDIILQNMGFKRKQDYSWP